MPEPRPKTLLQELSNALLGEGGVVLVDGQGAVDKHRTLLCNVLQDFVPHGHVSEFELPLLVGSRSPKRSEVSVGGPGYFVLDEARWPSVRLHIGLTAESERGPILAFTFSLRSATGEELASVHLDEKHGGDGACSHAVLHAHPARGDHEVRVPLPALSAAEALRWLLLLALPEEQRRRLEPAPWDEAPADVKSLMGIPLR